ncbi:MAG: hypothetical protein R3C26_00610 [Calditrichia bacterium]
MEKTWRNPVLGSMMADEEELQDESIFRVIVAIEELTRAGYAHLTTAIAAHAHVALTYINNTAAVLSNGIIWKKCSR